MSVRLQPRAARLRDAARRSEATCCAADFKDFGGADGCATHGCVVDGACTPSDPRCYGAFKERNAFCRAPLLALAEPDCSGSCGARHWTVSGTKSSGGGYRAVVGACGDLPATCGTLTRPDGACELTLVAQTTGEGIGAGHAYLFAGCGGDAVTAVYRLVDAAYGCGYALAELRGGAWHELATLCFEASAALV